MTQHTRGNEQHEHAHSHGEPLIGHHHWHDAAYVKDWIETDVTRDDERRPLIRQLLSYAPQSREAAVEILDVGAGYGVLSDEALKLFPKGRVTLQDYSQAMFDEAKQRLAAHAGRIDFVTADFGKPDWAAPVGKTFDIAISGIAIHNLGEPTLIQNAYKGVASLIKPGGVFLDMDYLTRNLTVDDHVRWLREAGFSRVDVPWREERRAMFAAFR